jgi:plasmid stability protein
MPTLYVENVPEDLYEALRTRAREHRQSITAEVLTLLAANVPTAAELARRKAFLKHAAKIRSQNPQLQGTFTSSEEMQREDRGR